MRFKHQSMYSGPGAGNSLSREDMKAHKDVLLYESRLHCRAIRQRVKEEFNIMKQTAGWTLSFPEKLLKQFAPLVDARDRALARAAVERQHRKGRK